MSLNELLKFTGLRLCHSLPPLLVMAIPFWLLLVQLAMRFERCPALPHEPILLEVILSKEAWPRHDQFELEVPSSIQIEAGPHRDPTARMLTWSIEPLKAGEADLHFQFGSESFTKSLSVSFSVAAAPAPLAVISPITRPSLPMSKSLESIHLHYPSRVTPLFGFLIPWWLTFLLVAMLFALLARPLLHP